MAGRQARIQWIERFKGYADLVNVDDQPLLTNDLNNVHFRLGRIKGRGGMTKYQSISTAAAASIIGLFNYRQVDGSHDLIRLLRNGVEHISAGTWTSIEGTALSTVAETTQPQSTIIDDTLVFTNGTDRPQKYTGSGTTAPIASGTSPYSKGLIAYLGFLFLTNVSVDGTFTDLADGARTGYFSDDWDNSWEVCAPNTVVLDETPGAWLSSVLIGRSVWCLKSDGVVKLTFTPGATRFHQVLVPAAKGIISPLALWSNGTAEAFYIGTDAIIYHITEQGIEPISHLLLSELLFNTISLDRLKYARGMVDPQNNSGYFFYDRTGLANQLLNSYVEYNYYTKEFAKGTLGVSINAATDFKASDGAAQQLIVGSPTLVENFDSSSITDDGAVVSRYWTSNWQKLKEVGWFHGVEVIAKKSGSARIVISIALDGEEDFTYKRFFTLKGGSPSDTIVTLEGSITPLLAESVNVRIAIFHDSTSASSVIEKVGLVTQPLSAIEERPGRGVGNNAKSNL